MRYAQLVKRNILIYLRDKGAVFFSLISMLVILCLTVFFLGDINISTLTENLALLPNRNSAEDEKNALLLVLEWTAGGIIPVNAVMVTLSSFSAMIKDRSSRRADAILTSSVSKSAVALSYVTAACISSIIVCSLTFIIAQIYCMIKGAAILSVISHTKIFLMIAVNSFAYSAIMYLCASLVTSEGAWSGLGTVIGALVGFFGGIYMPIGQLSATLISIIKCTPVIYSTVMFRQFLCDDILQIIFNGVQGEIVDIYKETMGITISVSDKNISPWICAVMLIASGIIFLFLSVTITERTRRKANK